jgi:hypothetical protein
VEAAPDPGTAPTKVVAATKKLAIPAVRRMDRILGLVLVNGSAVRLGASHTEVYYFTSDAGQVASSNPNPPNYFSKYGGNAVHLAHGIFTIHSVNDEIGEAMTSIA